MKNNTPRQIILLLAGILAVMTACAAPPPHLRHLKAHSNYSGHLPLPHKLLPPKKLFLILPIKNP